MSGLSPKNPRDYVGPNVYIVTTVTRDRRPLSTDYRQPETGKLYPISTLWQVGANPTTGVEGEIFVLTKIVANTAYWEILSSPIVGTVTSLNVDTSSAPGTNPVGPDIDGEITITGGQVAAGTIGANAIRTNSVAANTFTVQIQRAAAAASSSVNNAGILSLNSTHFTIDANGYADVKTATEQASSAAANAGVASFLNSQFDVDANGFVSLQNGLPIASVNVDANTGPGTDPVVPDSSGQITVTGAQVASGTIGANAIRSNSLAANTYTIEIQRSAAAASSSVNNAGISSYDNRYFGIDSSGWAHSLLGLQPNFSNFSMAYSAGTLTVRGANGSTISTSNPAYVTLQNPSTLGQLITVAVTNNYQFTDNAGSGDINGNTFGTSSGAWAEDMPMFLYFVVNSAGNHINPAISRVPHLSYAPAVGSCAAKGSAVATTEGAMYFLDEIISGTPTTPTVADYAAQPAIYAGMFRIQKPSVNNWTVQSITINYGMGKFPDKIAFGYPPTQNGATSNIFLSTVGGDTIPTFTTTAAGYRLLKNGQVYFTWNAAAVSVNGVGTGILQFTLPLAYDYDTTELSPPGNIIYLNSGAANYQTAMPLGPNAAAPIRFLQMVKSGAATAKITPADWTTDKQTLAISVQYPALSS